MANLKLACLVLMCMAVVGAHTTHAITCGQVTRSLIPCLSYLQRGGTVPRRCCDEIRSLASAARTTYARRTACKCLKSAAGAIRSLDTKNAAALPRRCRVNIPYKISTSTNCARIR